MERGGWLFWAISGATAAGLVGSVMLANAAELPDLAATGPAPMTDSSGKPQTVGDNGLKLIEQFEGLELTGYLLGDGMCTIGYGHAVPVGEKPNCTSWTITQAQAEQFLAQDVERFGNEINTYFTRSFNQNQFDALVSFSYNVGYAYEKYTWPKDAPDSYFPGVMIQYTNPPQFKDGLTRRRQAEIALFEDKNLPDTVPNLNNPSSIPTLSSQQAPVTGISASSASTSTSSSSSSASSSSASSSSSNPMVTQYPAISPLISGGISAR